MGNFSEDWEHWPDALTVRAGAASFFSTETSALLTPALPYLATLPQHHLSAVKLLLQPRGVTCSP